MNDRQLYAVKIAALAAVYYGAAKLGLQLAFETPSVTAVWPPTGIALAALVLWGYRLWPGVALGAFLANITTGGVPVYAVLGITTGNTLEALTGAYLLHRFADFRPTLARVRDVLALAGFGAVVSTAVSATFGVTSLLAADEISTGDIGSVWRTWWLGDMGGDLIVAPALMLAVTHWPWRRSRGRLLEAAALGLLTAALCGVVFTRTVTLTFLLVPPLIWACLRFQAVGAIGVCLVIASIAIPLTEEDMGPFSGNPPDERLLLAQAFVGVASLSALVLAALVIQRQRVESSLQYIATTLQESLLPTDLPDIPGADVAVDFRPAGERHLVGGDFYDWFQNNDGSWSLVVGDVIGKGAPAAAITALARYTMREAATRLSHPSSVLHHLNEAILRQSPGQLCTVVFVRMELDATGGGSLLLSVGGHPPPLVLRASGTVEPVGRGTLLGLSPSPEIGEFRVDLAPGDALVLYTDGLTDAYAPKRIVSPDELATVVGSCAGRGAREVADRIEAELLNPDRETVPRDDIVLLVLRLPAQAEGEVPPVH